MNRVISNSIKTVQKQKTALLKIDILPVGGAFGTVSLITAVHKAVRLS